MKSALLVEILVSNVDLRNHYWWISLLVLMGRVL